jgi:hypothetical protein
MVIARNCHQEFLFRPFSNLQGEIFNPKLVYALGSDKNSHCFIDTDLDYENSQKNFGNELITNAYSENPTDQFLRIVRQSRTVVFS